VILRSSRVVLPDGIRAASIHVEDGRVVRVGPPEGEGSADYDFGRLLVAPGIVDTHVHVNEPGRSEWEGFATATLAAAAGGVTTLVDMPLNAIPPTTTVAALEAKRSAARGRTHVDVAFWGGVVPGNARDLAGLVDAGVRGFKCFLAPSGVDEFPHVVEADLREAMPILRRRGVPLLVHAEDPKIIADCSPTIADFKAPIADYQTYAATRPPIAEVSAIEMMIRLAREFGTRVHIVHVASADAVDVVARAKAAGAPITAETCPHYLTFAAEDIPDGATEFKCAPPIRESRHREALWWALAEGSLDLIASDHSPAPPSMKPRGDFATAWGGISSLELSLAACATGLMGPHSGCTPERCATLTAQWLSAAPARLAGLERKGRIAPGCDADFVVWDPDAEFSVDPARLHQRHPLTPYAGRRLRGVVKTTFLRGERIWDDGALMAGTRGQLL
jgi:allantoinase